MTYKDFWKNQQSEHAKIVKKAIRDSYTHNNQIVIIIDTETNQLSIEYRQHGDTSTYFGHHEVIARFDRRNYSTSRTWPNLLRDDEKFRDVVYEFEQVMEQIKNR